MRYLLIINAIFLLPISYLVAQPDSIAIDMQDTTIVIATPDVDTPRDIVVVGGDTILLDKMYFNSFAKPVIAMSGDIVVVSLKRNENDFNSLLDNCNKTSDLTVRVLETTEQSLNNTKSLLTDTQTSLAHANDLLKEANKARKASRRKATWEKVLIGAGGAAVGILVGALVIGN